MHFWNINALVEDFKNDRVPSSERFKYFLVFYIFNIAAFLWLSSTPKWDLITIIDSSLYILVSISGLVLCYRVNKKGDDKDFVDRFVAISLPVTIRWLVIGLLSTFLLSFLAGLFFPGYLDKVESKGFDISIAYCQILEIFYFYFLYKQFLKLSRIRK